MRWFLPILLLLTSLVVRAEDSFSDYSSSSSGAEQWTARQDTFQQDPKSREKTVQQVDTLLREPLAHKKAVQVSDDQARQ